MNSLPNDIRLIVYRYLHSSLKIEVNKEYKSEYLNRCWDENSNYFRTVIGTPMMMFRTKHGSGKWGYQFDHSLFIYRIKVCDKKGIIVADLPKNY